MSDREITKEEFDARIEEKSTETSMDEDDRELITFDKLLDIRSDISDVDDQLNTAGEIWSQVAVSLDEQREVALQQDEGEKADAIDTIYLAALDLVSRIDGGAALPEEYIDE